jgi:hypothetical protein
MKKLLLAAFLLIGTNEIFSQINQGQWLVGGNINFTSSKFGDGEDDKVTSFNVSPNVGYFFIDKLAAGLRLGFDTRKVKSADDGTTDFSLAPFVRYYLLDAMQKVNVFADGSYGFGKYGTSDKESYNFFQIMAGPAVFLTPHTALELAVFYKSEGGDLYGDDDRFNHFGVNIGFQIHLGNGNGGGKK